MKSGFYIFIQFSLSFTKGSKCCMNKYSNRSLNHTNPNHIKKMQPLTILIVEGNTPAAWAMNTVLIAGLIGFHHEIQIVVCTTTEEKPGIPNMFAVVDHIEEADIVLLSENLWCYKITDFGPYLAGKQVITTSPDIVNGYNRFTEKAYLLKRRDDPKFMEASANLCNLVRAGLETRLKLKA